MQLVLLFITKGFPSCRPDGLSPPGSCWMGLAKPRRLAENFVWFLLLCHAAAEPGRRVLATRWLPQVLQLACPVCWKCRGLRYCASLL
jgi:hypothetical protein